MKTLQGIQAVWLFGLPCSGKTTLATALTNRQRAKGRIVKPLDGDVLRKRLSSDLGYGEAARTEHLRRSAEVARLFLEEGALVVAAFITPLREHRVMIRDILAPYGCQFVHVRCPQEECERRDVKGQYARARRGEIEGFTGLDGRFEGPLAGESAVIDTEHQSVADCMDVFDRMLQLSP